MRAAVSGRGNLNSAFRRTTSWGRSRDVEGADLWEPALRRLKGRVGHDGIERFSTHDIFDILEVPMRHRSTQTIRLSKVIRVYDGPTFEPAV